MHKPIKRLRSWVRNRTFIVCKEFVRNIDSLSPVKLSNPSGAAGHPRSCPASCAGEYLYLSLKAEVDAPREEASDTQLFEDLLLQRSLCALAPYPRGASSSRGSGPGAGTPRLGELSRTSLTTPRVWASPGKTDTLKWGR